MLLRNVAMKREHLSRIQVGITAIRALATVMVIGGCTDATSPPPRAAVPVEPVVARSAMSDDPQPEPPPPVRLEQPGVVRYHMRRHFDDVRMIERLLLAGKLDEGLALAYLLVHQTDDPGMAPWDAQAKRVTEAAVALTKAPGLDEALRREARLAAECANCHAHAQTLPAFAVAAPAPRDAPSREARMARHVWATDRLWEGLVGATDDRWKAGLEVLAATPLPFTPITDAPGLAARLQRLAHDQLDLRATTSLDDRANAYGEMLVTCAACHSSLGATIR